MGAVRTPVQPHQDDRELQKLREDIRQLGAQVASHPMFRDGEVRELTGVSLPAAGNVVLRHGLRRRAERNIVVRATAGCVAPLTFVSSGNGELTVFHAGTACTADVWVF